MTISPLSELLKATTLEFTIWHDPVAAVDGIPADSDDALVWWTPTLGPTAVLCLHRLSRYLTTSPSMSFDIVELAGAMGLVQKDRLAASEGFTRAMHRLEMFGMIRTIGNTIHVRTILPPLPQRFIRQLPANLRDACPWAVAK